MTKKRNDEIGRLVKMVVIVTVLFLAFYVVTLIVTKEKEIEKTPTTIQYDEILIGNLLEQPNDEYYVLVAKSEESSLSLYLTLLSSYGKQENSIRYYTALLDNPFNDKFEGDTANLNVTNILELRIAESTLFKVKGGKITNTYQGEEIEKHLTSLIEKK